MLDAIGKAKNASDVIKAIKNKMQNFYKIREDDTDYAENGIIDGERYVMVDSAYDNTALRQIPIFFINKVEDGELLKEFSTGLTKLASTAINYDAMQDVSDIVEFIGDFAKDQAGKDPNPKADYVGNKLIGITHDLYKWGRRNSNTEKLIEGYISQYIYGQKLDPNQPGYKWAKALGHNIVPLRPGLNGLIVPNTSKLSGLTLKNVRA